MKIRSPFVIFNWNCYAYFKYTVFSGVTKAHNQIVNMLSIERVSSMVMGKDTYRIVFYYLYIH